MPHKSLVVFLCVVIAIIRKTCWALPSEPWLRGQWQKSWWGVLQSWINEWFFVLCSWLTSFSKYFLSSLNLCFLQFNNKIMDVTYWCSAQLNMFLYHSIVSSKSGFFIQSFVHVVSLSRTVKKNLKSISDLWWKHPPGRRRCWGAC